MSPRAPALERSVSPIVAARPAEEGSAIRAEGLVRRYGTVTSVDGVDMEVRRGEVFGLVGPDGAGKTTLIQMLCGILDPTEGRLSVLGLELPDGAARLTPRLGYMSQAFSLYGNLSVGENIEFFADIRGVSPDRRRERTERLLRFSRLAPFVHRPARDLSGGMKKKLALATTLVHDPDLLLLDEPTTGVDPLSRRDFWRIVSDFVGEGVAVVVATPYLDEAERCDRVALMHEGRLLAVDPPRALKERLGGQMAEVRAPDQAAALAALRADPDVRDAQVFGRSVHALLRGMSAYRRVEERLRAGGLEVESARCIEPGLEDVFVSLLGIAREEDGPSVDAVVGAATRGVESARPAASEEARSARAAMPAIRRRRAESGPGYDGGREPGPRTTAARSAEPAFAVVARGLTRRFGRFTAVDAISFTLEPGEVFGFLGPNGSGKSTTIRMLTGILPPSAGEARIVGLDVATQGRKIRPLIGYMSQKFSLYDDLTVRENLEFFAGIYGVPRRSRNERIARALATVDLEGRDDLSAGDLPGGWKQRLALASAILHRPAVLFLDEPTSGVDPVSRRSFWDLIFEMAARGRTILVTTHYMDEAERCHRVALLDAGRLVATGTPAELRRAVGGRMLEVAVRDPVAALATVQGLPGVRQSTLYGARLHVLVTGEDADARVRNELGLAGHAVESVVPAPLTMEDTFAALVGEADAGAPDGRAEA